MITLGQILKEARLKKHLSINDLEKKTKIKASFLSALESQKWQTLPEYPVVVGFVKSVASFLDVEVGKATALLRRDYPPEVVRISPKPDVGSKFVWGPKLTFLAGLALLIIGLVGYLGIQYSKFVNPPNLVVSIPTENQVEKSSTIKVIGNTNPEATVTVNDQPVIVTDTGDFDTNLQITQTTTEVIVISKSRAGRQTVIHRKIKPEL